MFFSATHGTINKTDLILDHKPNLKIYIPKRNPKGITPCIVSNQHGIKLELKNNRNNRKFTNSGKLNDSQLCDNWIKEEVKNEIKDFLEYNENESTAHPKF